MILCYSGISNRGDTIYSNGEYDIVSEDSEVETNIVHFCRKAFKEKYKSYWIDVVWFDDKYFNFTQSFYSEVQVDLYPKITNLRKAFKKAGIKYPTTKEEWEEHNGFVWEIVHKDIQMNIDNLVVPITVRVKGVRIPTDKKDDYGKTIYKEVIKSVKEITQ